MKIAITGGGITGLTFMNYLRRTGADVTLYEKKKDFSEQGSGLMLGINAMKILRDLGLEEDVLNRGQRLDRMNQADTEGSILTGFNAQRIFNETGLPTVCISRPDLHAILHEAVKGRQTISGKEVAGANCNSLGTITLKFSDGSAEDFDMIIGADGIFSTLREDLCGKPALRYSGYTCWRFMIDRPKNVPAETGWEFLGAGKRFGVCPIGPNRLYCFATLNAPEASYRDRALNKEEFRDIFGEFLQVVPDCLEQLTKESSAELIQRDIADLKRSILYKPGHPVIFAGDAGHATTPNLGQGAAMGMEDAYTFSKIFQRSSSAVDMAKEFDRKRKARVESIRRQSLWLGKFGQLENQALVSLRNFGMRRLGEAAGEKTLKKLLLHTSVFGIS